MTIKGPLSEQEKILIIQKVEIFGRRWELIGTLLDRAPSTIRTFYDSYFGFNWIWQEDNAPPHRSLFTKEVINKSVPNKISWPAKSPDLSPIEQVWDYMKSRISGYWFDSKEQLFFLRRIWLAIPKQKIHNYYSSFLARCIVCNEIGVNSLNGHWRQVKIQHDKYRTDLMFVQDQLTFQIRPFEIPATIKNSEL